MKAQNTGADSATEAAGLNEGNADKVPVSDAIVSQSKAVWWDMLIRDLTETMHRKSREIVAIYEDADDSFKLENDLCAGNVSYEKRKQQHVQSSGAAKLGERGREAAESPNVWDNFYAKLAEIDVSQSCHERRARFYF